MVIKKPTKYELGKTLIYFIRPGRELKSPVLYPHDFSLSELGKKQAKQVAKKFSRIKDKIDLLYTSPMKRAYETAIEIGKAINKQPIILKGFEEIHKNLEYPNIFSKNYWKSKKEFKKKQKILDRILEKDKEKVIVLVAHGRLNRMLIGRKLGLSYKKAVFLMHIIAILLL